MRPNNDNTFERRDPKVPIHAEIDDYSDNILAELQKFTAVINNMSDTFDSVLGILKNARRDEAKEALASCINTLDFLQKSI